MPNDRTDKIEVQISNAHEIPIRDWAPPTALSVKVRLSITPPDGAVLVYTPATIDAPILCRGPVWEGDIPVRGEFIYVQQLRSASTYTVEGLGYRDDI